jgi:hypothetical protein
MSNEANGPPAAALEAAKAVSLIFDVELTVTPNDPEAAFDRALQIARAGVLSGAGWALWPERFWQRHVRSLVFAASQVIPPMSSLPPDFRISPTPDRLQ